MSAVVALAGALPVVTGAAGLAGLLLRSRRAAAGLAVGAVGVAFLAAVALLATASSAEATVALADFGTLAVAVGVRVDEVTAVVAVAVCAVALAVQVYSTGYLAADDRYAPYAAQVSLFTAAMLLVVVSADLVTLLVGWEVMGLCSYLLIGHDRSLPEAPGAAVKAFLVTRVGDVGFLLGVVVLGVAVGSFRIGDVLAAADELGPGTLTAACLLLLAGVAGKSAQFPLHTWLPDAMAGPSPVSALIHAATMVAAGVYVVARLFPLFGRAPTALAVLGVIAAVTMLLGACAALAQDDLKRVLAWSTVSQLAYMTGALAVGSPPAALFHLLTHAAFKALLFLAAGAVIHAVATNALSAMGGLRVPMPVTFAATTVGLAALAGVPPFAGFWSKESVLGAAHHAAGGHGPAAPWVGWLVLAAGLLTTMLTGAYAARLWLRTFFGASRGGGGPAAHDPPPSMRWPLVVLAVPAALLGVLALRPGSYAAEAEMVTALLALVLTALGALAVWAVWRRDTAADPVRVLGGWGRAFRAGFWLDDVQHALVVRPVRALARAVRTADTRGVDGVVTGTGRGAVSLGRALSGAHASGLGRYVTVVCAGAVLLAAGAVLVGVAVDGAP